MCFMQDFPENMIDAKRAVKEYNKTTFSGVKNARSNSTNTQPIPAPDISAKYILPGSKKVHENAKAIIKPDKKNTDETRIKYTTR